MRASTFFATLFVMVLGLGTAKPAYACGPCVMCAVWQQQVDMEIQRHEQWFENIFWNQDFRPGLEQFTTQIVSTILLEARMIGGFMDAQNHLNAQRTLQEMTAQAMKNYTPSEAVCKFGTLTRSLAASQARGRNAQLALSERSLSRQLGKTGTAAALNSKEDRQGRLDQFRRRFCDTQDNNNGMQKLCISNPSSLRHNLDIDFTRTVDTRPTLNIDFTDGANSEDERDVIALASNLYAHDIFKRYSKAELGTNTNGKDNRTTYMDLRAIVAKRNVAEHSFNTLVGMKAAGSASSRQYVRDVLTNLGMPAGDVDRFMASGSGATQNPSYSAQMEILTKKIYQDPAFYANLMDKPANVQRQYAAMQSFGLMQQRDIFETILRSEMLLSLIVEMEIAKYQDTIQNRLNQTK